MPQVCSLALSGLVRLSIWRMDETVEELFLLDKSLLRYKDELMTKFHSESRRREYLSVRTLLSKLAPGEPVMITYNDDGSPRIDGYSCSISHTRGYACLILSTDSSRPVAVDIEQKSDRVGKIVSKFVRKDEEAPDTLSQLIHWCAKETLYKLCHEDVLEYFDMRLMPFHVSSSGKIAIENLKRHQLYDVYYQVCDDYVLTYSY
jgi:phosphopantetheinyl transferase